MAVLSSRNGKFYEIPDADLKKYELPADKVKEVLAGIEGGPGGGGGVEPYGYGPPPQVVIHVTGGAAVESGPPPEGAEGGRVEPYGYYGYYGYHPPYWGWRRKKYYYYGY